MTFKDKLAGFFQRLADWAASAPPVRPAFPNPEATPPTGVVGDAEMGLDTSLAELAVDLADDRLDGELAAIEPEERTIAAVPGYEDSEEPGPVAPTPTALIGTETDPYHPRLLPAGRFRISSNDHQADYHETKIVNFAGDATYGATTWATADDGEDETRYVKASAAPHVILDGVVHSDSVADTVTTGSLIYGNTSTPSKWDELGIEDTDDFLMVSGGVPTWLPFPCDGTWLTFQNNQLEHTGPGAEDDTIVVAIFGSNLTIGYDGMKHVTSLAWDGSSTFPTNTLLDGTVHSDTSATGAPVTRGSIIRGVSGAVWQEYDLGTTGHVLTSNGTDVVWAEPAGKFLVSADDTTLGYHEAKVVSGTTVPGTALGVTLATANGGGNETRSGTVSAAEIQTEAKTATGIALTIDVQYNITGNATTYLTPEGTNWRGRAIWWSMSYCEAAEADADDADGPGSGHATPWTVEAEGKLFQAGETAAGSNHLVNAAAIGGGTVTISIASGGANDGRLVMVTADYADADVVQVRFTALGFTLYNDSNNTEIT